MSLHPEAIPPLPELTAKVARRAFRKGHVYMQMRDVLGTFFTDNQFAGLYPVDGQPAYAPCWHWMRIYRRSPSSPCWWDNAHV